jgi:hypothetical protein
VGPARPRTRSAASMVGLGRRQRQFENTMADGGLHSQQDHGRRGANGNARDRWWPTRPEGYHGRQAVKGCRHSQHNWQITPSKEHAAEPSFHGLAAISASTRLLSKPSRLVARAWWQHEGESVTWIVSWPKRLVSRPDGRSQPTWPAMRPKCGSRPAPPATRPNGGS